MKCSDNFTSSGIVYEQLLSSIPPNYLQQMKIILFNYITNVITYELAHEESLMTCGNCQAVDKLLLFMNVSDEPISAFGTSKDNHYQRKSKSWSQYEDQRLIAGVHKFGPTDWTKISQFVGNGRNRCQCSQRWARSLNPLINKTLWNQLEDFKLITAVNKYGDKSWTKVSNDIAGRTDVQCRYRYQIISKNLSNELGIKLFDKNSKHHQKQKAPIDRLDTKDNHTEYPAMLVDQNEKLRLIDWINETTSDPQSLFHTI